MARVRLRTIPGVVITAMLLVAPLASAIGTQIAGAATRPSPSSEVRNEYGRVLLAEYFGPARAVCSQLTRSGLHAYSGGAPGCTTVFRRNQRSFRLIVPATKWAEMAALIDARLNVTVRGRRATARDAIGVLHTTEPVRVGARWEFTSAPPLPTG
jgi:hypothetical protein